MVDLPVMVDWKGSIQNLRWEGVSIVSNCCYFKTGIIKGGVFHIVVGVALVW